MTIYSPPSNEFGDILEGRLFIKRVLKPWRLGEGKFVATKVSMSEAGIYFDEDIDEILFWLHVQGTEYVLFFPFTGEQLSILRTHLEEN